MIGSLTENSTENTDKTDVEIRYISGFRVLNKTIGS
jgi:hypothetical protein